MVALAVCLTNQLKGVLAVGESDSSSRTRPGTFTFSGSALTDIAHASASGTVNSEALSVAGSAGGPQTSYNASASTGTNTNGYYYYNQPLNLSLSANSLLLIDASVSLKAKASNPTACSYYYCNSTENASASASSYLSYNYSGSGVSASYTGNKSLSLQATASGEYSTSSYQYDPALGNYTIVYTTVPKTEPDKSLDDTLRSVFTNSTDQTQSAIFGLSVAVSGQASTAPIALPDIGNLAAIPEPGTFALLFEGLAVGAWVIRRNRRA